MEKIVKLIKNSGLFALMSGAVFWVLYLVFFAINKGKNLGEYEYLLTLAKYSRDTGITLLVIFGLIVLFEPEEPEEEKEQNPHSRRR